MMCIGAGVPPATMAGIPRHRLVQEEAKLTGGPLQPQQQRQRRSRSPCPGSTELKAASASQAVRPVASPTWVLASAAGSRIGAALSLRALRSVLLLLMNGFLLLLLVPFRRQSSARAPAAAVARRRTADREAAARRGLAIKRVREAAVTEEESGGARSRREFAMFVTARGDTLFTQSWAPVAVQTRGLVIILHGLNEHSGRYDHFAKQLNGCGFKVQGMDWIGHGGSDGLHGYVHSLDYAVDDLKAFLQSILAEHPGLPCFIFGHSTGAAIILKAVLDPNIEACIKGVVLTSPAIHIQPSHPIVAVVAPIFALIVPKYQFNASYRNGPPVSRDPEALRAKYTDPLVFTGSIRVRTGYELLKITSYLQQNLKRITVPFLVLHGTADTVTDPEASKKLYVESCSSDKTIKLYEGLLHDLLFEPERDEIARDIIDWLSSRVML